MGAKKALAQVTLTAASAIIYTAPAQPTGAYAEIYSIWITNTDIAAAHGVTMTVNGNALNNTVLAGAGLASPNMLNPGQTMVIDDPAMLAAISQGASLYAFADTASKVTVSVFGSEVSGPI